MTAIPRPQYPCDLANCIVWDIEVYPGRLLVGFYGLNKHGQMEFHQIDGDVEELRRFLDSLARRGRTLVGYNSSNFDGPVVRAFLGDRDPYETAQWIIDNEDLPWAERQWLDLRDCPPLGVDHIDLCARLKTKGRYPSLKSVAANLGRPKLQELPYPPGTVLSDSQWGEVASYNRIDLGHTWALLEYFLPELEGQAALSAEYGIDLRSATKAGTVKLIFRKLYRDANNGREPPLPERPVEVIYRPPSGVVRPRSPGAAEWYDLIVNRPFPVPSDGPPRPVVPNPSFDIGGVRFRTGKGGLHSIDKKAFYRADRDWEIWDADVASYYPEIVDKKRIFARQFGDLGSQAYRAILDRRLQLKAAMKTASSAEERARLDIAQYAFKIILNSTFGQFGERYSPLFDQEACLGVTLTGQLMLVDLVERLQAARVEILSGNTDGLLFRARRDDGRWRDALDAWQKDTELTLEINPLECLLILATNIYASRDLRGKVKRKGAQLKDAITPNTKSDALVIGDAIVSAFLDNIPPEVTIAAETRLSRFCFVTRSSGTLKEGVAIDDMD